MYSPNHEPRVYHKRTNFRSGSKARRARYAQQAKAGHPVTARNINRVVTPTIKECSSNLYSQAYAIFSQ
jgi:hypothetical protein